MTFGEDDAGTSLGREDPAGARAGRPFASSVEKLSPSGVAERLAVAAVLALATGLRIVSLTERGMWDADQGRDLLVLRSLLVDGVGPLLGPVTSVGGIHHGAAYYYLLAPLAMIGGLDPGVVVLLFVAAGVAMVGLVWWLARSIAGPVPGLAAGLLAALSPAAIAASVTIWNPNLVGPAAALTLAAAWRAWVRGEPRWWILTIAAAGLTVQLHVLAVLLSVPVAALLVADVRRTAGPQRARVVRAAAVGAGVVLLLFVPLIVHELTTGFGELRAAVTFLGAERGPAGVDAPIRLLIATLRMASWPIVGLVVDAPLVASLVACLVIAAGVWRWRAAAGRERLGAGWLLGTLAWSALGLTFAAPDLATVVRGLPNDQYHAFTDPIVPVLIGLGIAGLTRLGPRTTGMTTRRPAWLARAPGPFLAVVMLGALLIAEAARFPPLRDPNGGWPAARAAADRVVLATGKRPLQVIGLPAFKPTDGLVFPLRLAGADVAAARQPDGLVVVCDRLFEPALGASCGGSAEAAVEAAHPGFPRLVDRFNLSERTSVSVYLPATGG